MTALVQILILGLIILCMFSFMRFLSKTIKYFVDVRNILRRMDNKLAKIIDEDKG